LHSSSRVGQTFAWTFKNDDVWLKLLLVKSQPLVVFTADFFFFFLIFY